MTAPTTHQIILLNGPRRSGKDTAANIIIKELINVRHLKFSGNMKRGLKEFFCLTEDRWKALEGNGSNEQKLLPLLELFGMSWVDAQIWFSEDVMKPTFGSQVFGEIMCRELAKKTPAPLTVISDCGFGTEVEEVAKARGPKNCHLFQLHRPGCSFKGDSRDYLDLTYFTALGVNCQTINNEHDPAMYRIQVLRRVNKILGIEKVYE